MIACAEALQWRNSCWTSVKDRANALCCMPRHLTWQADETGQGH